MPFYDVNGDGFCDPIDVLIVVNFLNDLASNGEGEAIAVPFIPPVVSQNVWRVDAVSPLNGRLANAEGEFVANANVAMASFTQFVYGGSGNDHFRGGYSDEMLVGKSSKDKLRGGRDNDLLIRGSAENQDDLASLDALLADWGSGDWAYALFDLDDIIDDDDEDDLKGAEGLDLLLGGVGAAHGK